MNIPLTSCWLFTAGPGTAASAQTATSDSAGLLGVRTIGASFSFYDSDHSDTDYFSAGLDFNLPVAPTSISASTPPMAGRRAAAT